MCAWRIEWQWKSPGLGNKHNPVTWQCSAAEWYKNCVSVKEKAWKRRGISDLLEMREGKWRRRKGIRHLYISFANSAKTCEVGPSLQSLTPKWCYQISVAKQTSDCVTLNIEETSEKKKKNKLLQKKVKEEAPNLATLQVKNISLLCFYPIKAKLTAVPRTSPTVSLEWNLVIVLLLRRGLNVTLTKY